MRHRNVQIPFRLTEDEAARLNDLVRRSGRSREDFLRTMIAGYVLREKPDPEFYKILRELSAIGNRLNQLTAKAHSLNFIDTPMLDKEVAEWRAFQMEIRKKYLLPEKINGGV